ncbi:N(4)-(beta-N-acetylglucosaminyl)-L-asparaginase [Persicobacter psychrovividus]|uniref:N(4)-(Beta-N-acetylglucosaminyl)-L-asparaginase n=1 Tax=Persicobacter psychrovividus TaxID=387638 RepID=A0ABM7VLD3_9BACT|nr:N(4)-(beta-N-acetylglucosaminyl)-L-asparaginase [Persicobacter psychrovividus]
MKNGRRSFLKKAAVAGSLFSLSAMETMGKGVRKKKSAQRVKKPMVISTWNHGVAANAEAWRILSKKGTALDAVELGVRIPEADPKVRSVGYGGYPDRDGNVTLDACIMDHRSECGSVAFLQHIKHPISVARKVMEETPHVMIVGEGAYRFAIDQGFKHENLLTDEAKKDWEEWKEASKYEPVINIENHDTIGMLALDEHGKIAGSCTTSGAAWKMHGRVGDSPIIGGGLFIDGEVGGAVATGLGEAVIRTAAATIVVELMRNGYSAQEAADEAIQRIIKKHKNHRDMEYLQIGILSLNINGEYGASSIRPGFNYAIQSADKDNELIDAPHRLKG